MPTPSPTSTILTICPGEDCDHGVVYRCGDQHATDDGCLAFMTSTDMCCIGPEACEVCQGVGQVLAEGADPAAGLRAPAGKLTVALLRELELEDLLSEDLDMADGVRLPLSMYWNREAPEMTSDYIYWPEHVTDAAGIIVLDCVGGDVTDEALVRLMAITSLTGETPN